MRLHALLQQNEGTATGILIPDEFVAALGTSRRPAVRVTINGYSYRSSIAHMGGEFWLGVSADVRSKAGVQGGDELDIDIELDTEPREVEVPADFQAALDADEAAKRFFEGLSYSNKRRIVLQIEGTKVAETRQRRILRSMEMLREGRA